MPQLVPYLRHLMVLREIARRGSVSAAARAIHLSQPAVTQSLRTLEHALGAQLFERSSRGVRPSALGQLYLARVERALQQLREGLVEAQRGRGAGADPLRPVTAAQLEALVAVAEAGAFGRAARARGRARATLHRAARQLERVLEVPLFEPTSHGVRPTREAERIARRVRLAAAELEQARAELASAAGAERGATVIGAMPLARSVIVPEAVLACAAQRPWHRIAILDGTYESLLGALQQGRADVLVGAMRETTPVDVVQEALFDDPLAIIVRAGHPLDELSAGGTRAVPADELTRYAWIAPRAGSPLRGQFDRLFAGIETPGPALPIECNSLVTARALLLASDRAMLLSAHQVHYELAAGVLRALPHPAGRVTRAIGLTTRRDWQPTAAQAAVIAALRAAALRHAGAAVTLSGMAGPSAAVPSPARRAAGRRGEKVPRAG